MAFFVRKHHDRLKNLWMEWAIVMRMLHHVMIQHALSKQTNTMGCTGTGLSWCKVLRNPIFRLISSHDKTFHSQPLVFRISPAAGLLLFHGPSPRTQAMKLHFCHGNAAVGLAV